MTTSLSATRVYVRSYGSSVVDKSIADVVAAHPVPEYCIIVFDMLLATGSIDVSCRPIFTELYTENIVEHNRQYDFAVAAGTVPESGRASYLSNFLSECVSGGYGKKHLPGTQMGVVEAFALANFLRSITPENPCRLFSPTEVARPG